MCGVTQFKAQSERAGWAGTCWVGRWKEGKGVPGLCTGQEVTVAKEWEGDVRPDTEVPVYRESIGLSCGELQQGQDVAPNVFFKGGGHLKPFQSTSVPPLWLLSTARPWLASSCSPVTDIYHASRQAPRLPLGFSFPIWKRGGNLFLAQQQ